MAQAERVIADYRQDAPAVREAQWRDAATLLTDVLHLDPADRIATARLRYCEGHLQRIDGEARKRKKQAAAQPLHDAVEEFEEAARLDQRWPDPYLGLARTYIYGLDDLDRAIAALQEAESRGYRPGNRELVQLADGYRSRAERMRREAPGVKGLDQERDYLEKALEDYRQAFEFYRQAMGFGEVSANMRQVQTRIDETEARLDEIPRTGFASSSDASSAGNHAHHPQHRRTSARPRPPPPPRRLGAASNWSPSPRPRSCPGRPDAGLPGEDARDRGGGREAPGRPHRRHQRRGPAGTAPAAARGRHRRPRRAPLRRRGDRRVAGRRGRRAPARERRLRARPRAGIRAGFGRTRRLPSFRERIAARKAAQAKPGAGDQAAAPTVTVPLLTGPQLSALRPALSVRAPGDFRKAVLWAVLLFLAGFYVAHAWLSWRGSTADQVLLPIIHLLCGVGLVMMVSLRDPVRDPMLFVALRAGRGRRLRRARRRVPRRLPAVGAPPPQLRPAARRRRAVAAAHRVRQRPGHERREGEPDRRAAGRGDPAAGRAVPGRLLRAAVGVPARAEGAAPRAVTPSASTCRGSTTCCRSSSAWRWCCCSSSSRRTSARRWCSRASSSRSTAWRAGARRWSAVGLLLLVGGFAAGYVIGYPAHGRAARADVGVALGQRRCAAATRSRTRLWALATRRAFTGTGLGPRRSAARSGGAHRPGPRRGRRGARVRRPAGRLRACSALLAWRSLRIALRAPGDYTFFLALGLTLSIVLQLLLIASAACSA